MDNILISAIGTYYPKETLDIQGLAQNSGQDASDAEKIGIRQVHAAPVGTSSTDMAREAWVSLCQHLETDPKTLDSVVWISEGVDDNIYMDGPKRFLKKINGRMDGYIHTYQVLGGSGGVVSSLRVVANQVIASPYVDKAAMVTAQNWTSHSPNRFLPPTYWGDGAGVVLIEKKEGARMILGTKSVTFEENHNAVGIRYGGTQHPITQDTILNKKFVYDIMDEEMYIDALSQIKARTHEMVLGLLEETKLPAEAINHLGVAGFHQDYSGHIASQLGKSLSIDPLAEKGYLGSLGIFEVISRFLSDPKIAPGETLLAINMSLDANVESILLKKP